MQQEPKLTIALTFKNRAEFLEGFFQGLTEQSMGSRDVAVVIADGGSTDNWKEIVERWYDRFAYIRTGFCDRRLLPFKVMSNCPAIDRNAMICNMVTTDNVIVVDPEVRFTSSNQLNVIFTALQYAPELLLFHTCYRMKPHANISNWQDSITWDTRPTLYGGYCLAFNTFSFTQNGGFDERYARGFGGEDSYFIWWWRENRVARTAQYPVLHLWHTPPGNNPEYQELRRKYTLPLHNRLKAENAFPNKGIQNWHRSSIIKDVTLWQG